MSGVSCERRELPPPKGASRFTRRRSAHPRAHRHLMQCSRRRPSGRRLFFVGPGRSGWELTCNAYPAPRRHPPPAQNAKLPHPATASPPRLPRLSAQAPRVRCARLLRFPASLADRPLLPSSGVRNSVAHPCRNQLLNRRHNHISPTMNPSGRQPRREAASAFLFPSGDLQYLHALRILLTPPEGTTSMLPLLRHTLHHRRPASRTRRRRPARAHCFRV